MGRPIPAFKYVLLQYSCPVILVEDGASYHGGAVVNPFQSADELRSVVCRALARIFTEKNPIEKLWKNTKKEATIAAIFDV